MSDNQCLLDNDKKVVYLNYKYNHCYREDKPSIDLHRLPPRPYIKHIPTIYPFTLICPIPAFRLSVQERLCTIYYSIKTTTLKFILNSLNYIFVFVLVQPCLLFFESAIRAYVSQRQSGDNRLVDKLNDKDCKIQ